MNLANAKMDDFLSLDSILIWGVGGQEALIESMYQKAEELDSFFVEGNRQNEFMILVSLIEAQTATVKSKLQELDQLYIKPLEEIKRDAEKHEEEIKMKEKKHHEKK